MSDRRGPASGARSSAAQHVLTDADLTRVVRDRLDPAVPRRDARCVVRPGRHRARWPRSCGPAPTAGVADRRRRAATPAWSAAACRRDGEVCSAWPGSTELDPVDRSPAQVTAGAGVDAATLQRTPARAGLDFGVDLAARDAATVGGLVATNAGGMRVLRYGSMREQVAGLEAVLGRRQRGEPAGCGLPKDNTGYDLTRLLAGSEGTLAVITAVRLRLVPLLPARGRVALVALDGDRGALGCWPRPEPRLTDAVARPSCSSPTVSTLVRAARPARGAVRRGATRRTCCWSAPAATDPTDELLEVLGECGAVLGRHGRLRRGRAAAAVGATARRTPRRSAPPACRSSSTVACRSRELAGAGRRRCPAVVAAVAPAARTIVFGHLNEGNLHVNVLDAGEPRDGRSADAVLRLVARTAAASAPSTASGRAKAEWLALSRSPAEIAAMRAVKTALDPDWRAQPGRHLRPLRLDDLGE